LDDWEVAIIGKGGGDRERGRVREGYWAATRTYMYI